MVFAATPPNRLGTLCRYYASQICAIALYMNLISGYPLKRQKVPYDLVYPLPSTCSLEDGALVRATESTNSQYLETDQLL